MVPEGLRGVEEIVRKHDELIDWLVTTFGDPKPEPEKPSPPLSGALTEVKPHDNEVRPALNDKSFAMVVTDAAIAALCNDLGRWRDRIRAARENATIDSLDLKFVFPCSMRFVANDSIGQDSLTRAVFKESGELIARLTVVENASRLAELIREALERFREVLERRIGLLSDDRPSPADTERLKQEQLAKLQAAAAVVEHHIGNALAAVEQLRTESPRKAEATSEPPKPVEPQAETLADGDDAGGGKTPGKAGAARKSVEPSSDEPKAQRCQILAYYASRYAELKLERKLSAQDAYDYWKEYGFDPADKHTENAAELTGYKLPDSFQTYQSQLSHGRRAFHDTRYESRKGRKGRSIVGGDEID